MSIPQPVLDDVRYDALVREAIARLPALSPTWTDHNASDPGITLVETLAYLCDGLSWAVAHYDRDLATAFAALLGEDPRPGDEPATTLRRAVARLAQVTRAVTGADIASVARGGLAVLDLPWPDDVAAGAAVVVHAAEAPLTALTRVVVAGEDSLTTSGPAPREGELLLVGGWPDEGPADVARVVATRLTPSRVLVDIDPPLRSGHSTGSQVWIVDPVGAGTSLDVAAPAGAATLQWSPLPLPDRFVVVHEGAPRAAASPLSRAGVVAPHEVVVMGPGGSPAGPELLQDVYELLRRRAPATSRLSVRQVQLRPVDVDVAVVRARASLYRTDALRATVEAAVRRHLDPERGASGEGWPFGFPVYRAALDDVIERVDGVDHVHRLAVDGDDTSDVWPLTTETDDGRRVLVRSGEIRVAVLDADLGW